MSDEVMAGAALDPPASFHARFTVHGSDVVELGRRGIVYARALAGSAYEVTSYSVSVVDLVRVDDPERAEERLASGARVLTWSCTIDATLTLVPPPSTTTDTTTSDGSTTTTA